MVDGKNERPSPGLELWERELARAIAGTIRTTERDDLESVLTIHLWQIKQRLGSVARNWRAFAATALRNKAANWIRDRQLAERKSTSLDEALGEETVERWTLRAVLRVRDADADRRAALASVWDELDEDLRQLWQLLLEEQGNQAAVARRLGKHRNTVRGWIRKILDVLERHGFESR